MPQRARRDADDRDARRDVPGHDRAGAHDGAVADPESLQHGGTAADQHLVADRTVPEMFAPGFTTQQRPRTQSCPMPERGLSRVPAPNRHVGGDHAAGDDHHAVGELAAGTDVGARMDQRREVERGSANRRAAWPRARETRARAPARRLAASSASPSRPTSPRSSKGRPVEVAPHAAIRSTVSRA